MRYRNNEREGPTVVAAPIELFSDSGGGQNESGNEVFGLGL